MDAFNYLSVLISIILGVAITQILQGVGRLVQARDRVVLYWPTLVWIGLSLVIDVQSWWALFSLRTVREWTFVGFFVTILHVTALALLSTLVLPDFSGDGKVDLRANYFRQRAWFFGAAVAIVPLSLLRRALVEDVVRFDADVALQLVFAGLHLPAALTDSERYHKAVVLIDVVLVSAYIALLFSKLR